MPHAGLAARGRLALIGANVEVGASCLGAGMGPAALRVAGLPAALEALGYVVLDQGDLVPRPVEGPTSPVAGLAKYPAEIIAWARAIDDAVATVLGEGAVPVVMGGDHSLAMGSVRAAARHAAALGRQLFLLWLDAHPDFNTPATSLSGNMHGMSVAALCGEFGLDALGELAPAPFVSPQNVMMFGIRSIDSEERELLRAREIDVVDMRLIDEHGVVALLKPFLARVADAGGMLHVSLDADFVDPSVAPGVGTPVQGGASYREAHLITEVLYESGLVTSVDLVELNPFLDVRGQTALMVTDLMCSLFGRQVYERRGSGRAYRMTPSQAMQDTND
jgi:arginase